MSRVRAVAGRLAQVLGELLITGGALLLLFVAWQLSWTDVTADRTQARTVRDLERQFSHPGVSPGVKSPAAVRTVGAAALGKAFALVRIPRFGRSYDRPVLEGTTYAVLQKGLGHYDGSAQPGMVGNFAIAGHRTTYGKPLNRIATLRTGDVVLVQTRAGWFVYAVTGHVIVAPTETDVIAAVPQHRGQVPTVAYLTMTSCHPEYSARQRYVVFATLQATFSQAEGLPTRYTAVPVNGG